MNRRGFSLAELLTSLIVTSAVVGLATHAIVGQLRFLGGVSAVAQVRADLSQVTGIVESLLWATSPSDIVTAQDSALEVRAPIGVAVACDGAVGTVTIPAPGAGSGLSAFVQMPDVGDRIAAFVEDTTGGAWIDLDLAAPPASVSGCARFGITGAWRLVTQQPVDLSAARIVHVLRPFRLSLYRASDNRWYLGGRDWNAGLSRFNGIQPIAGPLRPYDRNDAVSGLSFRYADSSGAPALAASDIATITIVARGETGVVVRAPGMKAGPTGTVRDSLAIAVTLRNGR